MADPPSDSGVPSSLRDPDFYFEDGSVVLSAKDGTQKHTTYFRLHKGMLARASPIFRDMFTLPSPSTVEKYDGAPFVEMHDDAKDLRELIALLYDPPYISTILEGKDFTLRMLGPTRLAKKYEIDWIRKMVASQLEKHWPGTLREWDTIADEQAEITVFMKTNHDAPLPDDTRRLREFPEPLSSILLARECDVTSILPFAFYCLLLWPVDPLANYDYAPAWKVPQTDILPPEDWRRLFVARQRIDRWFSARYHPSDIESCVYRSGLCTTTISLNPAWFSLAKTDDFLRASAVEMRGIRPDCLGCKKRHEEKIRASRLNFVQNLTYFFQLSGNSEAA
ncbi:hypothetical protein B0H16DRAFT_1555431 [Mycena metata]|uniref:BTB domain-containing protein n=1 Tax=Mycena metata TaxID=1033252 RepID=A0AAD7N5E2_9AGAR|nr:hypothetical protein B0H16DRAFT_1555431 [Mycena metata]